MNEKKRTLIIYILIAIIIIIVIAGIAVVSRQSVQKSVGEVESVKQWNKIMADYINKQNIQLVVDGEQIKINENKVFMSENMELMIPSDIIIETFDCAQNLYKGNKLIVEKGSSKAVMFVDDNTIQFNDNSYELKETVKKVNSIIYVPLEIFTQYLGYNYQWDSTSNTAILKNESVDNSFLPERYSYVEAGRINDAKDQGRYGTCWAFATLTALETTLMPEESYDFSEDNLVYNNVLSKDIHDGGDYIMSMAYLMAWKGPVLEEDDPYGDNQSDSSLKPVKHVQGAEIIPEKDYQQIKEKIYKYGGVESSMYMSLANSYSTSIYYNNENNAYCYRGDNEPNHDIVIVGWDDNYPKEMFNDKEIKGNGAFICQNSWGSDFGENGVFYVSYYDDCIGKSNVCYTCIERTDNYNNIYQSDLCGWTGTMGFEGQNTAYFANIYKAQDNEQLKAVGFYAVADNIDYEIFICENYQDTNSLNDRNHLAVKGHLNNKGYYTINLDKSYNVSEGKEFAIIVKVMRKGKIYKLIPVEMSIDGTEYQVKLEDGKGYFSSEGYNWQSAESQDCNICLKAYTNNTKK